MKMMTGKQVSFYSRSIVFHEKFQAVISELKNDMIILQVHSSDVFIPMGTEITVFFVERDGTYAFTSTALDSKEHTASALKVSLPQKFFRLKKRSCQRRPLDVAGNFFRNDQRNPGDCRVLDISESGAKIGSSFQLDVHDSVKLSLEINGKAMRNLPGLVRWKKQADSDFFEYGIEFELISAIRKNEIYLLLNNIHPYSDSPRPE